MSKITETEQDIVPTTIPQRLVVQHSHLLPALLLIGMEIAVLLLDAVLSLRGLWFQNVQLNSWFFLPTTLFFPGQATSQMYYPKHSGLLAPTVAFSWTQVPFLLIAFIILFLVYLLALRRLPRNISQKYIFYSLLLFGITYAIVPVVTSSDIYSYISYARMGVLYHFNPLTTIPMAIPHDPVYSHIYWVNQPSAYGPTWAIIASLLQWGTLVFGSQSLVPMIITLRLFALAMHFGSTLLIWSIAGSLQRLYGVCSDRQRILATLAFAWNPLLLLEAGVNAHTDTTLLFFFLFVIWCLLPRASQAENRRTGFIKGRPLLAVILFAVATCLKLNIIILLPLMLIFFWKQSHSIKQIALYTSTYLFTMVLLYAPFWQNGAIFNVLRANPTGYRAINSFAESFAQLYNGIAGIFIPKYGSMAENYLHTLTLALFVIIYALLCWRVFRQPNQLRTLPDLLRWMAVIWLIYCFVGAPWFWPWYMTVFFGLYALIEATNDAQQRAAIPARIPLVVRVLAFSMLSIYIFYTWGGHMGTLPGLPSLFVQPFSGVWVWGLPLLAWYGIRRLNKRAIKNNNTMFAESV